MQKQHLVLNRKVVPSVPRRERLKDLVFSSDRSSAGRIDLSACWLILQHICQDYYIGLQTAFLMLWLLHGYWLKQSEFTFFLHFILYILCSFNCFYIGFINLFRSYNPLKIYLFTFIILIMIKKYLPKTLWTRQKHVLFEIYSADHR